MGGTGPESGGRTCNTSGFPGSSVAKNPPATAGDVGSISGSGRSPGEGNGSPLQHSCLGNAMDRGAWWATVHGAAKEVETNEKQHSSASYMHLAARQISRTFSSCKTESLYPVDNDSPLCPVPSPWQLPFTFLLEKILFENII